MRTECTRIFKQFFQSHLQDTKASLHITQTRMAELLAMDTRSLRDIEHGTDSCGALTLVLYLLFCCDDPIAFLSALYNALKDALPVNFRKVPNYLSDDAVSYRVPQAVNASLHSNSDPVCPRCGKPVVSDQVLFCFNCGQRLLWEPYVFGKDGSFTDF